MACSFFLIGVIGLSGCGAEISGGALPINMQPERPRFVTGYDFDLLDDVRGQACAVKSYGATKTTTWFVGANLEHLAGDSLTSAAIGEAALDAIKDHPEADSLLVTRVMTTGHGSEKVCATVVGRMVRIKKAASSSKEPTEPPADPDNLEKPQ
ncbi:MAG TPA: hypothetical protein VFP84_33500 [Kofleriaceae bacterium]|nr:hypothetical protein [Kofleriaceae bacterium]